MRPAFTMIELLIAMALSAVVMFGIMQSYRTVTNYLDDARTMTLMDRKVIMLTNQLEKDISTAFMPVMYPIIESEKEEKAKLESEKDKKEKQEKPPQTPEERAKKREADREKRKALFMAEIDDGDFHKINGQKAELLKFFTFITTNALDVYGATKPRIVRVRYELVKDKTHSQRDKDVYTLLRKECANLKDPAMKQRSDEVVEGPAIYSHEVAHGLKGLFIQFVMPKEDDKKKEFKDKKEAPEELRFYPWGESKQTKGLLPQRAVVSIELWDEKMSDAHLYQLVIPIAAFPVREEQDDAKKKKNDEMGELGDALNALLSGGKKGETAPPAAGTLPSAPPPPAGTPNMPTPAVAGGSPS